MHIGYLVYPESLEERPMKTLEPMRSALPNTDQPRIPLSEYHDTKSSHGRSYPHAPPAY